MKIILIVASDELRLKLILNVFKCVLKHIESIQRAKTQKSLFDLPREQWAG